MVASKSRLIKKYKNRRLYDLETSQYITVNDLRQYVMDGIVFQVIDAISGKDITSATLLQIFVEMEEHALPFFSSDMLRQLIILSQHPMSKTYKSMLEKMMFMMEEQSQKNSYVETYQKAVTAWSKQTEELLNQWQDLFKS